MKQPSRTFEIGGRDPLGVMHLIGAETMIGAKQNSFVKEEKLRTRLLWHFVAG
jgi:hypothetical protein